MKLFILEGNSFDVIENSTCQNECSFSCPKLIVTGEGMTQKARCEKFSGDFLTGDILERNPTLGSNAFFRHDECMRKAHTATETVYLLGNLIMQITKPTEGNELLHLRQIVEGE